MAKRIRFERGQELQERACMVAAICIQPHVRKKLSHGSYYRCRGIIKIRDTKQCPSAHSRGNEREV